MSRYVHFEWRSGRFGLPGRIAAALVMIIAVILMAVAGVIRIAAEVENGTGGGFAALC